MEEMEASPSKRKKIMMNETTKSPEETKVGRNKRKKTIIKEKTPSLLAELGAMPVEVLVKIFNFLPNHDIRCGVSLVCKKFRDICQDESLVPVKDLCIYGHPDVDGKKKNSEQCSYSLKNIGDVSDIIRT